MDSMEELQKRMKKIEERFNAIRNREIEFLANLKNEGGDPYPIEKAKRVLEFKIEKIRGGIIVASEKVTAQRGTEIDDKLLKEIERIERKLEEMNKI